MTRRWFLKILITLGILPVFPKISFSTPSETLMDKNMDALTEAIMPGAEKVGVHEKLRLIAFRGADARKMSMTALDAMEDFSMKQYGRSFYLLRESEKDAVLTWMDGLPDDHIVHYFFERYRQTVIAHYYTNTDVWKTLKYNGPPQPKGFPDYHLPPGSA